MRSNPATTCSDRFLASRLRNAVKSMRTRERRPQHTVRSYVVRFRSPLETKTMTRVFTDRRDAQRFAKTVGGRIYR